MLSLTKDENIKLGIMKLSEKYKKDTCKEKVNLALGVYINEHGISPVFNSVKNSELLLQSEEQTKASYEMFGNKRYNESIKKLLFPKKYLKRFYYKAATIQTIGSCGALYLIANTLYELERKATVWISDPSWENHESIFEGYTNISKYAYKSLNEKFVDVNLIKKDLSKAKKGDYILLQVCCHNPTGMDLTINQWKDLALFIKSKDLNVIFDFAYQGFGNDVESDTVPIQIFSQYLDTVIIANSFSKNMGLYSERVGGLTLLFEDKSKRKIWLNSISSRIRKTYTIPPIHGSNIITTTMENDNIYNMWIDELKEIKKDIDNKRYFLFKKLKEYDIFSKLIKFENQKGMFVILNLNNNQIKRLREEFSVYLMSNGRISVASVTKGNIDYICNAIKIVIKT